jgi:hypothetical protein
MVMKFQIATNHTKNQHKNDKESLSLTKGVLKITPLGFTLLYINLQTRRTFEISSHWVHSKFMQQIDLYPALIKLEWGEGVSNQVNGERPIPGLWSKGKFLLNYQTKVHYSSKAFETMPIMMFSSEPGLESQYFGMGNQIRKIKSQRQRF